VAQRSFVVRVSGDTPRVVVEDVRTREKVVADSLEAVGEQIERWLQDGVAPGEAIAADQEEGVDA
jgi:muconolactone delta-isomerase